MDMAGQNTVQQPELVAIANIIDDKTVQISELIVSCIIVSIIAVVGSVGNVINILVLTRHGFTDSTNVLLMSVTVADLIFLLTLLSRHITCLVAQINPIIALTYDAIVSAYLSVPNRYFGFVSSTFVVIISIERFASVFLPLTVSRLFSPCNICLTMGVICFIWLVFVAPMTTAIVFVWSFSPIWNTTVGQTIYGTWFMENFEQIAILNILISILRGPVSVVIILSSSIAIGFRLRRASQKRSKMTTQAISRVDVKVVKMLVTVCMVYAVIAMPVSVSYILYDSRLDLIMRDGQLTNLAVFLENISDLLYAINASVNFLIYVTMSTKFYKTYISLFPCRQKA